MNEFPNKNSVIVMDNAKIHHDEKLVESIEQMDVNYFICLHILQILIPLRLHFLELNHG